MPSDDLPMTTRDLLRVIADYAAVVAANRTYLIELDAAIGDADHGENLDRGMKAALDRLAEADPGTPADVLQTVATALISKVGGAAGPLYGTAFLRAATSVRGRGELGAADLVGALRAGLGGVVARGKAEVGDKTMVDAWDPAVQAAEQVVTAGGSTREALTAAADAAEEGMRATIPMIARKGRASYLGERSAGHQDPGATSSALLFRVFADVADHSS
ncbi:dihydroxyacetone kinase subunit DhaL [Actinopolymorpha singaporensis]|uniref:Dihydroxyacetone kinase DhaL subunit n=1 Tax=Actinopolymorpha singaporensis TaxID=117157 RepID=A0A1H1PUB5_9ACTN|nr:dihydroxyacetone kinase subunit DhaL [Actinopolymorpha singaporensis]SDS14724.1 dihydroxyacetone kinase DhaL subunit [Actinopolymorpha singaporensis]